MYNINKNPQNTKVINPKVKERENDCIGIKLKNPTYIPKNIHVAINLGMFDFRNNFHMCYMEIHILSSIGRGLFFNFLMKFIY